jgi:hypothetical protein
MNGLYDARRIGATTPAAKPSKLCLLRIGHSAPSFVFRSGKADDRGEPYS